MKRSQGDVGPGGRIQYSTVQYSTAQHMIYHTIISETKQGRLDRQARPSKNQIKPDGRNTSADCRDGVKKRTPEAKPTALPS